MNGTETNVFDELLSKGSLWRCLRVGEWVQRFINNARNSAHKRKADALITEKLNFQKTQRKCAGLEQFEDDKLKLNLQKNVAEGSKVITQSTYLTVRCTLRSSCHPTWGSGTHWVSRLCQLVKRLIKRFGC